MNCLDILSSRSSFNFNDFIEANRSCGVELGEASLRKKMQEYLSNKEIVRVGRGVYCVSQMDRTEYSHQYSELACAVAEILKQNHPFMDFTVIELIQFNEFVNHQLAHNVLFVSVDSEVVAFAFETLKEEYQGKVLLCPASEIFHQYWNDNMIVIEKLITEAPKGISTPWHARLEKILVDLIADNLLFESVSEGEYPTIFEEAFNRYVIDESCLFRYAKRRNAVDKIKKLINERTDIVLKTKGALL